MGMHIFPGQGKSHDTSRPVAFPHHFAQTGSEFPKDYPRLQILQKKKCQPQ